MAIPSPRAFIETVLCFVVAAIFLCCFVFILIVLAVFAAIEALVDKVTGKRRAER